LLAMPVFLFLFFSVFYKIIKAWICSLKFFAWDMQLNGMEVSIASTWMTCTASVLMALCDYWVILCNFGWVPSTSFSYCDSNNNNQHLLIVHYASHCFNFFEVRNSCDLHSNSVASDEWRTFPKFSHTESFLYSPDFFYSNREKHWRTNCIIVNHWGGCLLILLL
jgi:hypothetical protein